MITEQEEITNLRILLEQEQIARQKSEKALLEKTNALHLLNAQIKEINKRVEEEVFKRTRELQSLARMPLENPEPVLRIDYQGKIIFCNEGINRITSDLRIKESIYSFNDFWHHAAREVSVAAKRIELEAASDNRHFLFICVPLAEEGYINIYGRDITIRKEAERQLNTTATRLTTLIASIHSGVLLEDQNRKIVFANQLFCDLFQIPVPYEQLEGVDCRNSGEQSKHLFKDPELFVSRIHTLLSERKLVLSEEIEMADGRILERHYIPIVTNNEYLGHLWKYNDITERKKSQFALQRSEEKYRNMIENMNMGLLEIDLKGRIVYVNLILCQMLEYEEEELIGKNASETLIATTPYTASQHVKDVIHKRQKGIADTYQVLLEKKSKDKMWVLVSGAPMYDNKREFIGTIGIILDISRQKQLEEDLRDAVSKTQASLKTKEIFLANMSHEIRTPMNAILGMSHLLHKTTLTSQQQSFLKAITTSAENLLVIINDILDFSKIEAGRMQLEKVNFNLAEVVKQVADIVEYKAEEKGLQIRTSLDKNIAKALKGDPYRLNQVLLNLAGNSVKFTEQGSVHLSAHLLTLSGTHQRIQFMITDTGIGIDKEKHTSIFDSFTQEDNSVTRKFGGTGLGLSICKRLVELMDGEIQVVSEKNKGTTMSFVLDFEIGDAATLAETENFQNPENILEGSHILLVEDNEFNRMLAATILSNHGARVSEAINGLEATRICKEHSFDLILMDIQMPEMNGIEATVYLRTKLSLEMPIIALTANAIKGEKERCIEIGMNDYMTKPFAEKPFIHCCALWLGKITKQETQELMMTVQENLYDLSQIREFSRGNQDFVKKMVQLFLSTSSEALTQFREYQRTKSWEEIGALAHKTKASIDNMGIASLKNEIREVENLGKAQIVDEPRMNQLLTYVEDMLKRVQHALQKDEILRS